MYSNILQIQSVNYKEQESIDAVVIMMNPGSRKPTKSNENILSDQISNLMVDCIPDETQYQKKEQMLRNKEVKILLFDDYLRITDNAKKGNQSIKNFFGAAVKK